MDHDGVATTPHPHDPTVQVVRADALETVTLRPGTRNVVVDLTGAEALSSQAVGLILVLQPKLRAASGGDGGRIYLAGPNAKLRELLRVTRLEILFDITPDVTTALAAIRSRPA